MNFNQALLECSNGKKIRRAGWFRDLYLYMSPRSTLQCSDTLLGEANDMLNLISWSAANDFEIYKPKVLLSKVKPGQKFTGTGDGSFYGIYTKLSNEYNISKYNFIYTIDQTKNTILHGTDKDQEVILIEESK